MGVAWASGINLYETLLALGIMSNTGYVDLPVGLEIVGDPLVLAAAGLMYAVEFFTDKIPGVDTGWDTLHTFVRIPAGARYWLPVRLVMYNPLQNLPPPL